MPRWRPKPSGQVIGESEWSTLRCTLWGTASLPGRGQADHRSGTLAALHSKGSISLRPPWGFGQYRKHPARPCPCRTCSSHLHTGHHRWLAWSPKRRARAAANCAATSVAGRIMISRCAHLVLCAHWPAELTVLGTVPPPVVIHPSDRARFVEGSRVAGFAHLDDERREGGKCDPVSGTGCDTTPR